jgi:hypothetical protein
MDRPHAVSMRIWQAHPGGFSRAIGERRFPCHRRQREAIPVELVAQTVTEIAVSVRALGMAVGRPDNWPGRVLASRAFRSGLPVGQIRLLEQRHLRFGNARLAIVRHSKPAAIQPLTGLVQSPLPR